MNDNHERRIAIETWPDADFEIRTEGDGLNFRGYAAVFDSQSVDLHGFIETIAPGAFAKSLRRRKGDIKMFHNHNWDIVLATKGAGTMRLAEDGHGLFVDADLPDNEWGRPVRDAVARGDITSMSFGFNVPKGGDEWNEDHTRRRLNEVYLHEVSSVSAFAAYEATSASVRHLAELVEVAEDEMGDAIRVLLADDGELTEPQHELLIRAINARSPHHVISQETAELMARLLSKQP